MEEISVLRRQIDEIDGELVRLFVRRMALCAQIGAEKHALGLPVYAPDREREKLDSIAQMAGPELSEDAKALYETLFALSRDYQARQNGPRCGLLGRKLGHSLSPEIHALLGKYPYVLYEKAPEELENFLKTGDFTGLNVTIPYKTAVLPFCQELSPLARRLGAVNTLVRRPDGSLAGYNTDYAGFAALIGRNGLNPAGKKCLVLGSGGASRAVRAVLEDLGGAVITVSRTGENHYGNLSRHRGAAILVNATPVGMFPNNGVSPVDLELFPDLEGVFDLIYNPIRTALVQAAEDRGIAAEGGLWMLVAQAEASAALFLGNRQAESKTAEIYGKIRRNAENIVLIGMPGAGKSAVAQALGRATGRPVVDTDEALAEIAGMPASDVLQTRGEAAFRTLETQVLAELGRRTGVILATGGGCVTRPENYPLLRQNGVLFWLTRPLDALPTAGRPLSQGKNIAQMFAIRHPLYEKWADYRVENTGSIQDTVDKILHIWEDIS